MKTTVKRIIAYILDLVLVSLVVYGLTFINFINPNQKEINKIYKEVSVINKDYIDFNTDFNKYYKDKKIDENEKNNLIDKYPIFSEALDVDGKLDDNNVYDKLKEIYVDKINVKQYHLSKYTRIQNITLVIISLLYFGVLQFLLKGQTLFKKLLNIKVVNLDNTDASIWKIIGRSLIVNEIIFTILSLAISGLKMNSWIVGINILDKLKYILEVALIFVLIVREDGRTIHDLLFKTKIVALDKNQEIIEPIENKEIIEADIIEEKEEKKKRVKKANGKKINNKTN